MNPAPAGGAGKLRDQVALITGGTSGIGRETALLFAREGARVVFTGRRAGRGLQLVTDIQSGGGQAVFLPADHSRAEDCQRVVETTFEEFGRLDVLFNNAGVVMRGTAESTTEEGWTRVMDLNLTAVWRMSRLVLPQMRAQGGGVIVNNASDWGLVGGKDAVAYCASKGAVVQLTRAMALDHARENIRVNAVCPGDTFVERWVESGYFADTRSDTVDAGLRALGEALPLGRVAQASEIAKAVLFLASSDSSFMTGATLVVDGGNTAM